MAPPAPPPPDEAQINGENTTTSAPMTNGPSNATGSLLWERAWTVDEIRKGAGNWSLAGDAGLLLLLQEFSQRMISRTHEIEKEVDGLVHIAKTSGVKLDNVFNDFIMLANTQFVENRVYDDDVSQAVENNQKPEEQEKSREQREAELIPKISQALQFGIKVIEDSFETLDVNAVNSDSEEEEGIPYRADPILEPKDPYVIRPLPHIIGSAMFMKEDDVGLVEPPSDAETESHGSISQSESEAEDEKDQSEYSSDEYSESESEGEQPKKPETRKTIHSTSSEESEGEGDLFGSKDSDEDLNSDEDGEQQQQQQQHKPKGALDFTSELAAKIGVAPKAPPTQESDEGDNESGDEVIEQKTKVKKERAESSAGKSKKKHGDHKHRDRSKSKLKPREKPPPDEDGDLFGGAPEEEDSPFSQKGLFSGSKGLFDDDGDEGGLFDDIEKPKPKTTEPPAEIEEEDVQEEPPKDTRPRTKSGRKVPAGGISIFGGGDDDLFSEPTRESNDLVSDKPSGGAKQQPNTSAGGLFDDEDDDLFSSVPTKSAPKAEKKKATKAVDSLFDEEEDDLFGDRSTNKAAEETTPVEEKKVEKPKKKLPAGAVSMFGNAPNPLAAALKLKLGVEDSDDEKSEDKGLSDDEKSRSGSLKSNHSTVSSSSSLNKPVEAVKKGGNPSPSGSSNSLFADEQDDDLFSTKPASKVTKKKSSLFAEDDTKGDLFGGPSDKEPAAKRPATAPKKSTPAADLFGGTDDSPEDDLFGIVAAKPQADSGRKKPVGGVALFGGADLFGKKVTTLAEEEKTEEKPKPQVIEKTHEVTKPTPRKNTLSLFDDEGGDDLFGGGSKELIKGGNKTGEALSTKKETKGRSKSKTLFADEDVLFGGPDTPSVDLFGESPPGTPEKKAVTTKPKPVAKSTEPRSVGISVKGATTTSSSTDLFGGAEDEDDLFGTIPKTQPKVSPKIEDGKLKLDDATTTETSDEVVEKKKAEPVAVKPKKPAGAVSMFGGIDPLAGLKKKQKSESTVTKDPLFDEDNDEDSLFTKPSDIKKSEALARESSEAPKPSAFKKPVGGVSLFGGFDPLGGSKNRADSKPEEPQAIDKEDLFEKSTNESKVKDEPASPPVQSKGIGKLKANLLINPAALLPGAAPPSKDMEPVAVDFNKPAESTTLTSASKDRVKIITRRRPMSRKARKQAALSAELDLDPEQIMSGDFSGASLDNIPSSILERASRNSDLFGNDDLLTGASKISSQTSSILSIGQETIVESVEDDIFSKEFTKTRSSSIKQSAVSISKQVEDDLFSSSSTFSATATTTTMKSQKVTTTSSMSTKSKISDDDLFSALESNKEITQLKKQSDEVSVRVDKVDSAPPSDNVQSKGDKPAETKKPTLPDDEDDIFADSSIIKKKETKPPVVEDDIFSDSILNKPAAKTEEKFDDDDIFTAATTKKEKKKKQVTKDEDLFKDNTDIFADLPASKPKEKKKKKTTTTSKKSVFKDDVDDIFADSNAQTKPKKETEKKKKTSSKKKEEVEDIFDDPLNAGP